MHFHLTLITLLFTWINNVRDRECNGALIFLTILLVHANKDEMKMYSKTFLI
jgi:hypothetical protein